MIDSKSKKKLAYFIYGIIFLNIVFAIVRNTIITSGDFDGYLSVGNFVLNGENIYTNPLTNTWPPFFSVVSVFLALINNLNHYLVKVLWLVASSLAMYKIIEYTIRIFLNKSVAFINFKNDQLATTTHLSIMHWVILIPVLISYRYIWNNLGNIQINIFMLFLIMLSLYKYSKGQKFWAALLLSFSISMKVYTIFLLLYFIFKRDTKMSAYTIFFTIIFALVPFLVFGIGQSYEYYHFWFTQNVDTLASVSHKNQSVFSFFRSLFTHESPGLTKHSPLNEPIYLNILDLSLSKVKYLSYMIIVIAAIPVMFLFRKKISEPSAPKQFIEYALVMAAIPVLTPLSWKAYFIFLFPAYLVSYAYLYHAHIKLSAKHILFLRILFFVSIAFTVFSSEMFVGQYMSDILEVFSIITIGSILLILLLLLIFINYNRFNLAIYKQQRE